MSAYPVRGSSPWDDELKTYIDTKVADSTAGSATDAGIASHIVPHSLTDAALTVLAASNTDSLFSHAVSGTIDQAIAASAAAHIPGIELAYAEKLANATSTSTSSPGTTVSLLSISVTGTGRPVDFEFWSLGAYHSVANTSVVVMMNINGGVFFGGIGSSGSTAGGDSLYIKKRLVVPNGVVWAVTVSLYGGAVGTSTLQAQSTSPIFLSATSR